MLFLDPPDHTRLRALVNKAFIPQAIEALKPRIRGIAEALLDQIQDAAAFDVIQTIAYPLPVIVMAELLGVPPEDRAQFKLWSDQRARLLEPTITRQRDPGRHPGSPRVRCLFPQRHRGAAQGTPRRPDQHARRCRRGRRQTDAERTARHAAPPADRR